MNRRCGICGERSEGRRFQWSNPHLMTAHPAWWNWFNRWRIAVLAATVIIPFVLVPADIVTFASGNILPLVGANLAWIFFVQIIVLTYAIKIRNVKRQWKKEHG